MVLATAQRGARRTCLAWVDGVYVILACAGMAFVKVPSGPLRSTARYRRRSRIRGRCSDCVFAARWLGLRLCICHTASGTDVGNVAVRPPARSGVSP
eukprot:388455-Rhodomonas_salina.2